MLECTVFTLYMSLVLNLTLEQDISMFHGHVLFLKQYFKLLIKTENLRILYLYTLYLYLYLYTLYLYTLYPMLLESFCAYSLWVSVQELGMLIFFYVVGVLGFLLLFLILGGVFFLQSTFFLQTRKLSSFKINRRDCYMSLHRIL